MKAIGLRLTRLERAGGGPAASCVARLPIEAMGDEEAVLAAIAEHRRRTGYAGAIVLACSKMTKDEWIARYGQIN